MKTYTPKKKDVKRNWYILDAEDQILGKVAVVAADIIRGKGKVEFSPHMDMGDYLIVINASKIKVTGGKEEKKKYYSHSWYPGGLKEKTFKEAMEKDPTFVIKHAVKGMLPKNRLGKEFIKKLKIYAGESHEHEAQNPQEIKIGK